MPVQSSIPPTLRLLWGWHDDCEYHSVSPHGRIAGCGRLPVTGTLIDSGVVGNHHDLQRRELADSPDRGSCCRCAVDQYQGRDNYLDPLPQALLLTAIVIAFALTAFMLALIYRSWMLARQDEISDDEEDRRLAEVVDAYDPEEDDEIGAETSEFDEEDRVAGSEAAVLPRSSDERAEGKEGGTR